MPSRKNVFDGDNVYHIYSRSIAGFEIFNNHDEYERMMRVIRYYRFNAITCSLSKYMRMLDEQRQNRIVEEMIASGRKIDIIAYCIMPTHLHLVLRQLVENGIADFMHRALDSYSRYFNVTHKRKGPLLESRFKGRRVENDDDLLHVSRYIHLNPVSENRVKSPKEWGYSSYREYLGMVAEASCLCNYNDYMQISKKDYETFVIQRQDYQRILQIVKYMV